MFIDYLTMIMINMVAGTALLAYYLWKGIDQADQRSYGPAFGVVGLLALVLGIMMSTSWPLPGSYNIAFGEGTALFGATLFPGVGGQVNHGSRREVGHCCHSGLRLQVAAVGQNRHRPA